MLQLLEELYKAAEMWPEALRYAALHHAMAEPYLLTVARTGSQPIACHTCTNLRTFVGILDNAELYVRSLYA